jgi:predicted ATP-dependent serine protease
MCEDLINRAKELQEQNPKKQVVILQDSIQTLDDGKYADGGTTSSTPARCTEMLTNWAKATFGIVVFIGQVNKDGKFNGKMKIKHAVDVHGHIFFDDDKKSETFGERLFEIPKNRFGCNGQTYILGINKKGVYEKGSFQQSQDWNSDEGGDDEEAA